MTFKTGVPANTLANEMWQLFPIIDTISFSYINRFAVITSTTDGKHKKGSLHYRGLAVDLRIKDLTADKKKLYFDALKFALMRLCDVILESDHIHVEYQPKHYK